MHWPCKAFYTTETSMDASSVCGFVFGNDVFRDQVDATSLQDILDYAAASSPRLMLNVQTDISSIRDTLHLQQLMVILIEESTSMHAIHEDRSREKQLKTRALQR